MQFAKGGVARLAHEGSAGVGGEGGGTKMVAMQVVYRALRATALSHGDALAAKHIILRHGGGVERATQFFGFVVHAVLGPDAEEPALSVVEGWSPCSLSQGFCTGRHPGLEYFPGSSSRERETPSRLMSMICSVSISVLPTTASH